MTEKEHPREAEWFRVKDGEDTLCQTIYEHTFKRKMIKNELISSVMMNYFKSGLLSAQS